MGVTLVSFAIILLFFLPSFAAAYTWKLETPPVQCANFTISVSGSDGKPPYRLLLVPTSRIPDGQQNDPRDIVDQSFFGEATSVSLQLAYPAGSRFVAVVSAFYTPYPSEWFDWTSGGPLLLWIESWQLHFVPLQRVTLP